MVWPSPRDIDLAAFLKIFNEQCVPELRKVLRPRSGVNAIMTVR